MGLVSESRLHLIVIDPEAERIASLRKRLHQAGVYGSRVSAHVGDASDFGLPPYFASLVLAISREPAPELVNAAFASLRPYGGIACFPKTTNLSTTLPGAALQQTDECFQIVDPYKELDLRFLLALTF